MRRAAVSIPSNIAEGQGRTSAKEFAHFLSIANGSKAELETQLLLCVELGYLESQEITVSIGLIDEIGRILYTMMKKLK